MKTLGMTENGDLDFTVVDGDEEIMQGLKLELQTNLQEWFVDGNYGTDFSLFSDKPTEQEIVGEVARVIANEERVELQGAINVDFEAATRTANVSFTVIKADTQEPLQMEVAI